MVILLNFIPSGFSFNFTCFGALYIETGSIFLLIGSHGKPCFVLLERQKTKSSELLGNCQCCFSISCSFQPAGHFEDILRLERESIDSVIESLSLLLYLVLLPELLLLAKSLIILHFYTYFPVNLTLDIHFICVPKCLNHKPYHIWA